MNVIIAADGRPYALLEKEFPDLEMIRLPGYKIAYPRNDRMAQRMMWLVPNIIKGIIREHWALRGIIKQYSIELVISDGRFGLWNRRIPCVYITHQVMVKFADWLRFLESLFYKLHKCLIHRYRECWIPDVEGEPNLSGDLSHKYPIPKNALYIGPLSRMVKQLPKHDVNPREQAPVHYDLLVIISGPEQQRTIFEKLVVDQVRKLTSLNTLILQGKTEENTDRHLTANIQIVSHLDSEKLNEALLSADIVLARPGYCGIMDLAVLGKRAILVPTPGQTEQEYLAEKYKQEMVYYYETQDEFDLARSLEEEAMGFTGFDMESQSEEVALERVLGLL